MVSKPTVSKFQPTKLKHTMPTPADKSGYRRASLLSTGCCVFMMTGVLAGCGQSGALYLPEEAPSNTDFILYKANKTQADATSYNDDKLAEAAAENPEDY